MDQHIAGRDACIAFYEGECCEADQNNLPANPNEQNSNEWRCWNYGWNSYLPACKKICDAKKKELTIPERLKVAGQMRLID